MPAKSGSGRLRNPLALGFLVAIPIEALNVFFTPPLDVDIPSSANWGLLLWAGQWFIMHLPGLRCLDFFTRRLGSERLGIAVVYLIGYIDYALLVALFIFVFRILCKRFSKSG